MSGIRTPQPKTMAAVKSGVVASLIEKYLDLNSNLSNSLPRGSYAITLKAPGIIRKISVRGGTKGVVFLFLKHEDMTAVLSGDIGTVIPLPGGKSFFSALNAFQTCAGAVAAAMSFLPGKDDKEGMKKKTPLLLTAALIGVCEVYSFDSWLKLKSSTVPEGKISITVADNPSLGGVVTIDKGNMSLDLNEDKTGANANLQFKTTQICYDVLTGVLPAMGAVGDGDIMLRGRLPLIQGLFPLLDRFGEIMS